MDDRSRAILITVLAVFLLMFPGFAGICFGLFSLVDSILGFGILANDLNTYLWFIFGGICIGFVLLLVSVIVIILAFRKRKPVPPRSTEPIPPASPPAPMPIRMPEPAIPADEVIPPGLEPPLSPVEPIPPAPDEPVQPEPGDTTPPKPDEPAPPVI